MNALPKAKTENIVVQDLPNETLIYDLTTAQAFCLNETAARVFNACDGQTTLAELREKYRLSDEVIYFALDELKKRNLIKGDYASPFDRMNRREIIRKIGLASMIALPVISSLAAPAAVTAASPCFNPGGAAPDMNTVIFPCSGASADSIRPLCQSCRYRGFRGSGTGECIATCCPSNADLTTSYPYPDPDASSGTCV